MYSIAERLDAKLLSFGQRCLEVLAVHSDSGLQQAHLTDAARPAVAACLNGHSCSLGNLNTSSIRHLQIFTYAQLYTSLEDTWVRHLDDVFFGLRLYANVFFREVYRDGT